MDAAVQVEPQHCVADQNVLYFPKDPRIWIVFEDQSGTNGITC